MLDAGHLGARRGSVARGVRTSVLSTDGLETCSVVGSGRTSASPLTRTPSSYVITARTATTGVEINIATSHDMCCSNSLVDDRAGCVSDDETEKGFLVFSRKLLCEELFGDDIDFKYSIFALVPGVDLRGPLYLRSSWSRHDGCFGRAVETVAPPFTRDFETTVSSPRCVLIRPQVIIPLRLPARQRPRLGHRRRAHPGEAPGRQVPGPWY